MIELNGDILTISVQGYEESCIDSFAVSFNDAGQWREGGVLPYQGSYFLDGQYIDQPWQDEGCDVLGICYPIYEHTINLNEIRYEHIGQLDHETDTGVWAYETIPQSSEVQVQLNYYADAERRQPLQYETIFNWEPQNTEDPN